MDRAYCEKEINEILEGYLNGTIKPSDEYRTKIIDLLTLINDEVYLRKIYNYVYGFTIEQL